MLNIGDKVRILDGAGYSNQFKNLVGTVKKVSSCRRNVLIGFDFGFNPHRTDGLYEFDPDKVMPCCYSNGIEYTMFYGNPEPSFGVKRVIFSGPKTIVLWTDGTKTIVSCGAEDEYDYYSGFCAAVAKKLFGSTSKAKKVMETVGYISAPKTEENAKPSEYFPFSTVVAEAYDRFHETLHKTAEKIIDAVTVPFEESHDE